MKRPLLLLPSLFLIVCVWGGGGGVDDSSYLENDDLKDRYITSYNIKIYDQRINVLF